jgi:hypothetical protein
MSQSKVKKPDRNAAAKKKLRKEKVMTSVDVATAMKEASAAIDRLSSEAAALRRIIIAERAQVIYYTDQALGYSRREILDVALKGFDQIPEERQQLYVQRAIAELGSEEAMIPHEVSGAKGQKEAGADTAKKGKIEIVH